MENNEIKKIDAVFGEGVAAILEDIHQVNIMRDKLFYIPELIMGSRRIKEKRHANRLPNE